MTDPTLDQLQPLLAKLADFLEIDLDADLMAKVLKHVSFEHMKEHADAMFPDLPLKGGGRDFINKGTNGRWRDVLTSEDNSIYEARALAELGEDCAHWVATGELLSGTSIFARFQGCSSARPI